MTYNQILQSGDVVPEQYAKSYTTTQPNYGQVRAVFSATYWFAAQGVNKTARITVEDPEVGGLQLDPNKQYRITIEEVTP